jgi:glycogen(starch) synthase
MRILMTTDAVGGVWTYSLDLARALGRHGVTVDLAVMGPPPSDAKRAEARGIPELRLHEHPARLEWMDEPWEDVAHAGAWLLDLASACEPQIVHLNGYAHAALPFRAPVIVVAHSCVLSWWEAVHGERAPSHWDRYAAAVRAGVHAASVVVAPTRAMAASVVSQYGRPHDLRVIANGRWGEGFLPTGAKEPFVFTAGRLWDEAKNVGAVCSVASALRWPVIVAGDDRAPDGRRLVPGSVHHAGWLDGRGLRDLFSRAAIYALPARYEPFGLSALEAALSGCALVLGDIRSLREVWENAAVFVPPDNRRALASTLQGLIEDGEAREMLGSRARERASMYSDCRMAAAYAGLYRHLRRVPLAA